MTDDFRQILSKLIPTKNCWFRSIEKNRNCYIRILKFPFTGIHLPVGKISENVFALHHKTDLLNRKSFEINPKFIMWLPEPQPKRQPLACVSSPWHTLCFYKVFLCFPPESGQGRKKENISMLPDTFLLAQPDSGY
jgi:hypothetical protein